MRSIDALARGWVCLLLTAGCGEEPFSPSDQNQAVCGDGDVDDGETCDDGNSVIGDGCRPDCRIERCGDGAIDAGDACFSETLSFSGGGALVRLTDLAGDGSLDAVTANDIEVRLGADDGFEDASTFVAENFGMTTIGDFDGDGAVDVAVVGYMSQLIPGTETAPYLDAAAASPIVDSGVNAKHVASGDIDGDGHLDIVAGGSPQIPGGDPLAILSGGGDGSFTVETRSAGPIARVVVADVAGSDAPDVVALTDEGVITTWVNEGGALSTEPVATPLTDLSVIGGLTIGDVNGDGVADCVAGGSFRTVLALGLGDGSFEEHSDLMVGGQLITAHILDLDHDELPDLVFNANGDIGYLAGDGAGGFALRQMLLRADELGVSYFPNDLQLGDLNGDGALDVVVAVLGGGLRVRLSNP